MFLRFITRKKDGKEHRYYSVVENARQPGRSSPFQKTLLYLGALSDAQHAAWAKAITVFDGASGQLQNLSLFPDGRLLQLTRYTQPEPTVQLLLQRLGKNLPDQPPPKLITPEKMELPAGAL